MNIVLFGGAFDPIHLGHINMARRAAEIVHAEVHFIPARISVWKDSSVSKEDKLAMLKLALKNYPDFVIDDYELNSDKEVNYSIDTVRHYAEIYPNDNLYFLIGGDQACSFHKWNDAKELSELANVIYYPRDGYEVPEENIINFQMRELGGKTFDVASSDIRILNNLYLPKEVIFYIADHELYFMPKVKGFYSEKRFKHVISVAKLAVEIAEANDLAFGFNVGTIFSAGILHDIAKSMPIEKQKEIMETNFPEYINLPEFSYHQFVGSYLAKEIFMINDVFILESIEYHATGRANMTTLDKIIYAADKTDPNRPYNSMPFINALKENIDEGFLITLKANVEYLRKEHKSIDNMLTTECLKYYKVE